LSVKVKRLAVFCVIIAGVFFGTAAGVFFAVVHDLPQIRSLEDFSPSATTRVYSSDNAVIAELFVEKRDPVRIDDIPAYLVDALVSTEDRNFYRHSGIDLKGIARAFVRDVFSMEFKEGGSTLTQQLAKTLFLTSQKNLLRKIREAVLAFQIERRYTKREILEFYLNQIYFGSGAYGVKAAARVFFNKNLDDLTLAECALIAGMPKSPSRYSPLVNKKLAIWRRNVVLGQMLKNGKISRSRYDEAVREPLELASQDGKANPAGYFTEYIRSSLEDAVGVQRLYRGGLSVYTTLSWKLQQAAQAAVCSGLSELEARMAANGLTSTPQAALVSLDVRTGGVLAMTGGRDFQKSPFNRATSAIRQPGSAFKPVLYACALSHGFTQATTVLNTPVTFPGPRRGTWWTPENFSKDYSGEMTLRRALVHSENIPAVRVINKIGPASVARFAARLGITSPMSPYLSLALGTSGVSLIELTGAYAVFPRHGIFIKPYGVSRIVDRHNRLLWQARPVLSIALSPEDAAIMTDMLQGVIRSGTGRAAQGLPCPVAGKTGTTDQFRDALFIGFSRDVAAGVWAGTDDYTTLGPGETGARAALPIWRRFMKKVLDNKPCKGFDIPEGMVREAVDPVTGKPKSRERGGVLMLFKKGTQPGS